MSQNKKPRIRVKAGTDRHQEKMDRHAANYSFGARKAIGRFVDVYNAPYEELKVCRKALAEAEAEIQAQDDQLMSYELRTIHLQKVADAHLKLVDDLHHWRTEDRRSLSNLESLLQESRAAHKADVVAYQEREKQAQLPTGWIAVSPSVYDDLYAAKRGRDELKAHVEGLAEQLAGRIAECDILHAQVDSLEHRLDAISDITNYDDK